MSIKKNINKSKKFLEKSLSVWASCGYDSMFGGYVEALDLNAQPLYNLDKRFRIHPRTIFSHAAGTFWGYYNGLATAEAAFEFMINKCWLTDGGFATLSDRKGNIIDSSIKTYDHAFVMLGLGWLYKVTNNPLHKKWLLHTWDMLNSRLLHRDTGFITSIPHIKGPIREQNPHMHMLEAALNLVELFDEDIWRTAAKRLYTLFEKYFVLPHEGKLREFFNDNWMPDIYKGSNLNPGHHYEWTWILQKYESLMNEQTPMIDSVYQFALLGSNSAGLGYDETDFDGNPIRNTHRLWVQTEVLKAHIAMYKRTQNTTYLINVHYAWEILFNHYLINDKGIWYDQLDNNLNVISHNAPTSSLYHVLIALHEYISLCNSL